MKVWLLLSFVAAATLAADPACPADDKSCQGVNKNGGHGSFTPDGGHGGHGSFTPDGGHGGHGSFTPDGGQGGHGSFTPDGGHGGHGGFGPPHKGKWGSCDHTWEKDDPNGGQGEFFPNGPCGDKFNKHCCYDGYYRTCCATGCCLNKQMQIGCC